MMMIGMGMFASDKGACGKCQKKAILMVHFGTTFDEARATSIDAINELASKEFPNYEVRDAFTSRIVMKRLADRGIVKDNPQQALLKLAAEGYTEVFIQPTNIIDGIEHASLREEAEYMAPFFKDIRVGRPLLYSVDDCEAVAQIIATRHAAAAKGNGGVVLVGHGTETPATAIYSQMNYMFAAQGTPHFLVSTVEGYPTFETTLQLLKKEKIKEVTLVPFMFVAGDHAHNDIDGEWRENLEKEGFRVKSALEGLGQVPEIQQIFISHIRQGLENRPLTPSQHKKNFISNYKL